MTASALARATTATDAAPAPLRGSAGAVLARTEELVVAVDELIGSEQMRSIGRLIAQLGLGEVVGRCVAGLRAAVAGLRRLVAAVRRATADKDAISGLLGLLRPLVAGVGAIARASADELERAGLGGLRPAVDPVRAVTATGARWLRDGQLVLDRLPGTDEVERLGDAVDRLIAALDELVALLQAEPAAAAKPRPASVDASTPTPAAGGRR